MKRLVFIILALVLLVSCTDKYYVYEFTVDYTICDQPYTYTGEILAHSTDGIPIVIAKKDGILVDIYPHYHAWNSPFIIYQGNLDFKVSSFTYKLADAYLYNELSGNKSSLKVINK